MADELKIFIRDLPNKKTSILYDLEVTNKDDTSQAEAKLKEIFKLKSKTFYGNQKLGTPIYVLDYDKLIKPESELEKFVAETLDILDVNRPLNTNMQFITSKESIVEQAVSKGVERSYDNGYEFSNFSGEKSIVHEYRPEPVIGSAVSRGVERGNYDGFNFSNLSSPPYENDFEENVPEPSDDSVVSIQSSDQDLNEKSIVNECIPEPMLEGRIFRGEEKSYNDEFICSDLSSQPSVHDFEENNDTQDVSVFGDEVFRGAYDDKGYNFDKIDASLTTLDNQNKIYIDKYEDKSSRKSKKDTPIPKPQGSLTNEGRKRPDKFDIDPIHKLNIPSDLLSKIKEKSSIIYDYRFEPIETSVQTREVKECNKIEPVKNISKSSSIKEQENGKILTSSYQANNPSYSTEFPDETNTLENITYGQNTERINQENSKTKKQSLELCINLIPDEKFARLLGKKKGRTNRQSKDNFHIQKKLRLNFNEGVNVDKDITIEQID